MTAQATDYVLDFDPLRMPLRAAMHHAKTLKPEEIDALLLYYGALAHKNTNRLRKEVERMSEALQNEIRKELQEVRDGRENLSLLALEVSAGYAKIAMLIETEVVELRSRLRPDSDPAVANALRRIGDLLDTIKLADRRGREAMAMAEPIP